MWEMICEQTYHKQTATVPVKENKEIKLGER